MVSSVFKMLHLKNLWDIQAGKSNQWRDENSDLQLRRGLGRNVGLDLEVLLTEDGGVGNEITLENPG